MPRVSMMVGVDELEEFEAEAVGRMAATAPRPCAGER